VAVVSAVVTAAAYVPFFVDAAGFAARTHALPRAVAVENDALVPGALLTALSPAMTLLFRWDTDISMRSVYLGALAPLMATLALCRRGRETRWRLWLVVLGVLSVVCALATIFPLRGWLYDCCLPFRYFRHPALFRVYLLFSVVVLALYGCRDLHASVRLRLAARPWLAACAPVLLPSLIALSVLTFVFITHRELGRSAETHALIVWTLAPALLLLIARPAFKAPASSLTAPSQKALLLARRGDRVLAACIVGLAALDGCWCSQLAGPLLHAADWAWYRHSEIRYQSLDLTRRGLARGIEDLNNTNLWHGVPVLRSYSAFTNPWYDAISKHPVFARASTGAQRIFFVADAPSVTPDDRVLASLLDRATALNQPVLALQRPNDLIAASLADTAAPDVIARDIARISTLPPAESVEVHVDRYTTDEMMFSNDHPSSRLAAGDRSVGTRLASHRQLDAGEGLCRRFRVSRRIGAHRACAGALYL
jgi:hypothetical protein